MTIDVRRVDYRDPDQARLLGELLSAYAADSMGRGRALTAEEQRRLGPALAQRPHAFSLIAYCDGVPAGLANCLESFSTFACQPIVNIHDLAVLSDFRGRGISQALLGAIEAIAADMNCCKITLEVLSNNHPAKAAYEKYGFMGYTLYPESGHALFWEKPLAAS